MVERSPFFAGLFSEIPLGNVMSQQAVFSVSPLSRQPL
jgi:hypothetical protein